MITEVAKAASVFMEVMRAHPYALSLVVMNLALLAIVWFELHQIFRQQSEINALLSRCIDPEILRGLGLIR